MPRPASAYACGLRPIRTARDSEYAVFAQVTGRAPRGRRDATRPPFRQLARAVIDNQRLWGTLARGPDARRQRAAGRRCARSLISLAEFVRRHSLAVLGGRASVAPLIDINTAIMKGLRGDVEAAA